MHNSLTRNKNSTKDTWGPHWSAPEGAGGGRSIYKRNSARSYPSHPPVLAGEAPSAPLAQRRGCFSARTKRPPTAPRLYGELCREPRHPARARGRHWRRGSRAEAEAEKKWSRKGWPRESREGGGAGAGMRARPGGVGWSGLCLRRSVSKSVGPRSPRAGVPCLERPPATEIGTGAPSVREPHPFPGLFAGSSR